MSERGPTAGMPWQDFMNLPRPDPSLIAWVWYHRTMDAEDRHWRRPGWGATLNAARGLVGGPQPREAIDIAERSYVEGWTAERLEEELPGYTEFAKWADANMKPVGPVVRFVL